MTNSDTFTPHPLGDKLWQELQNLNSEDVCRQASVQCDSKGFYSVAFMDKKYRLYLKEERVEGPEGDDLASDPEFHLLLLTYLTSAQEVPFAGKWVSERDLQGGSLFFKGPHQLPIDPLFERFGKDPEKFLEIGMASGGTKIAYGDVALEFMALPRVPVVCILWAEDDEFPARVSFLFDPSIQSHLPLDVILALIRSVTKNLLAHESSG